MRSLLRSPVSLISAIFIASTTFAGCSRETSATATPSSQAAKPDPASTAANASITPAVNQSGPGVRVVTGEVTETMNASSYTYVKVRTGTEEVWAAAGTFDVAVGDHVVVPLETPMENFHSASLNRDFPLIYFASHIRHEGEPETADPTSGVQTPMSSHGSQPAPPTVTERMTPPQGGISIAKVWETRKALAGKQVTVRGKVVKVNNGIMGRNWLHLQDGSGRAEDRNNDLTVTSASTANVGDVITVTGTIAIDKDFTAGYVYPVMVENATIQPK